MHDIIVALLLCCCPSLLSDFPPTILATMAASDTVTTNDHEHEFVVHSTWNESRNDEFPQVLEYRRKWQQLGFSTRITPNQDIRNDIQTLDKEVPSLGLLEMFDNLATTNMRYDVWRYTKLYLEGGLYADVDVEPLNGVVHYASLSNDQQKPIIFEESNWPNNVWTRFFIPLVSDYDHLPAYGTCLVIAPSTPRNDFFLSLLKDMHPDQWLHVKEPKRTLMSVGPGHVTKFVQSHPSSQILVGYQERSSVYIHHGFGTWKSWMPKEKVLRNWSIGGILILFVLYKCHKKWRHGQNDRNKGHAAFVKGASPSKQEEEAAALLDAQQQHLRKRHNHSPDAVVEEV